MKRALIYIGIVLSLFWVPVEGADLEKMHPVEVVQLYREGEIVVLRTDTEDMGIGTTVVAALENLQDTTPGFIYLDTAQYLILTEDTAQDVEMLRPYMKKSLQMCYGEKGTDLTLAAEFLPAHGRLPQLRHYQPGMDLPKLTVLEKRLKLS